MKNDEGIYHAFFCERLELVEPKKTKNQRITALEKEVAELKIIVEELRGHKTIDFSPLVEEKPKSANQQRAEIIEKAKKFVEKATRYGLVDGEEGIGDLIGSLYDEFYVVEFHKKQNKMTALVTISLRNGEKEVSKLTSIGRAKCNPSDVFNEHIGKAIALGRALGLDVSEFEQAVQPTVAVGQIIEALDHDTGEIVITYEVDRISGEGYPVKKNGGLASKYRIINDTNTIYEEENK